MRTGGALADSKGVASTELGLSRVPSKDIVRRCFDGRTRAILQSGPAIGRSEDAEQGGFKSTVQTEELNI